MKTGDTTHMRAKGLLYTTVFILLSVFFLLLVEGGLRIIGIGYNTAPFQRVRFLPEYYQNNPFFINKYYPHLSPFTRSDSFNDLFPRTKGTGTLRLFVIGGSTAQGFPYYPNNSFSKIIERALATTGLYTNVEVINLGKSALSSYYVADVAPKILRYQPDGIIIYAGQNEYYGTITSLQRSRTVQKIYLALKEWRIFQLLFSLIERPGQEQADPSLMQRQFAKNHIPFSPQQDTRIAQDFIRNIDSVVRFYTRRGIPVFIYEPVVNLIDMPPFGSEQEKAIKPLITAYRTRFTNHIDLSRQLSRNDEFRSLLDRYPSNAHLLYLHGLSLKAEGKDFLPTLEAAKDHDTIPFRYRSPLRTALHTYIEDHADNPLLVFIPLREKIINRFGPEGFDNTLFIDHLHFNRKGQQFLAYTFTQAWLRFVNAPSSHFATLSSFFSQPHLVDESVFLHPYFDFSANNRIDGLLEQPPFSQMILPYQPTDWKTGHPFLQTVPESLLQHYGRVDDFLNLYFTYLAEKRDRLAMVPLINAIRWQSPGGYQSYYNIAIFLSTTTAFSEDAAQAWRLAILLSEKTNQNIFTNAIRYFTLHDKEDILKQWRILP